MIPGLDRLSTGAILLLPVLLMHSRAAGDILISLVAILFLLGSTLRRDWAWTRRAWVRIAAAWWGWLVVCSLPGIGESGSASLVQALAVVRFLLFAAALEHRLLRFGPCAEVAGGAGPAGGALHRAAIAAAIRDRAEPVRRIRAGPTASSPGRSRRPRADPIYSRLLFPAMLPSAVALLGRPGWLPKLAALALTLAGVAVAVLIGQRMPVLLIGLGLVVSGLFIRRLRPVMAAAGVAALALIAATPIVSPQAYHRLVQKFSAQMEHFPTSDYGRIAARAVAIAVQDPWTGRGFDGFRTGCADPRYFHGWAADDTQGGGAAICVQHPHNHYLQAATESGFPGLALFCAMVLAWLLAVGRGLWREPDPLRVGLFVAVLLQEWPVASTSDFVNMPLGGWFFLLLGFGLAEAQAAAKPAVAGPAAPPYMSRRIQPGVCAHVGNR